MKFRLRALLLLMMFLGQPALATTYHLVLDIDWTTFYSVETPGSQKTDPQVRTVEGQSYRYTDALPEVLEALLLKHPDLKISFFSGGERSRNEALLAQVHLPDGRSLKDVAYRIFSKEHLLTVSDDPAASFSTRFKKDLSRVLPEARPEKTLMIDDQVEFAVKPYKAVHSLGYYDFAEKFTPVESPGKYQAPGKTEWRLERNKALIWLALVDQALRESKSTGASFPEGARRLWLEKAHSPWSLLQGQKALTHIQGLRCSKVFSF